ncbi:unnamed protein product [Knipowitschia caucasica]
MDVFGGAPRFLAYPRPVLVQSGADAVLKCQIGGDPRPAVIWERNNDTIKARGRYRVFEDGNVYNLIIAAVTVEDSGQYICKAKNSIGETYAAATLKVEGEAQEQELREENKPRFLIKPLSTRAGRGEDAVFSCKVWGNPKPDVVWEKDGKKLTEIFESTHFSVGSQDGGWFQLKIFKTRAPDGGVYTCTARNEFGEELAGAVLLVDAGPGHEDEGQRGNGYTNGQWKSGGGRGGGRSAPNRVGDTVTKTAKVKMFAVTEGKHAKFRCFVTGKPKPEIIWRKDGRLILSGRRYLLYEDREGYFTLKVLYCKQKDNGVYVCAASNTAGQTLSAVHLTVKEPPVRFKQPLIDLEVWERDLAVLECEVPEDSVPITWYLEDRRLQPGDKYGMEQWGTKRRLTIRDIGVDDDGIYLCELPDGGRSIAEVAVRGTILRKLPRKVDVLEGENAAFCVEVEKEEMEIHWYKDGVELKETHQTILKSFGRTHILVFVNTNPQDTGQVMFYVDRSKTSSQLRVKAARHSPPSAPVSVQINTERANAALLSWVPAGDCRKNPPSGYVLERQEVGTGSQEWLQCLTTDSARSVEILGDSVPCEADFRFRICSLNKYGKSANVEFPRTVHLVPVARIQAPLQDALVPEGQDAIFSIELTASVIGTWFLNGTQIQEDERFSTRRTRTHQSLRIRGVRDSDNGAEITFIAYGIRDSAALYIQAPLVKFSSLSEMDRNKFVEMGNPIVLYCELSDPAAPVHWYKNGVEIQTSEGLHIQSEGTMRRIVIQSAEFSHSGVYCCDAIDDVIRFNVEVEAPPVRFSSVAEADRARRVPCGRPLVLQCEVSEEGAQVQWLKDGSKVLPHSDLDLRSEGRLRTLLIPEAQTHHSGLYTCKTKGDSVSFSVDVTARPVLLTSLDTARALCVPLGLPVRLQCSVSEVGAPVQWFQDGMELGAQAGCQMWAEGSTRALCIPAAEMTHAGVYTCTTGDDSLDFTVDVQAIPAPTVFERTRSLEAVEPLELEYEVPDSAVSICWFKDNVSPLPPMRKHVIRNEPKVTEREIHVVSSAEILHSGLNRCETEDDATVPVSVHQKAPVSLNALGETQRSCDAGQDIDLTCEVSDPRGTVTWSKDGALVCEGPDLKILCDGSMRSLSIAAAAPRHSGTYGCHTDSRCVVFEVEVKAPVLRFSALPEAELWKSVVQGRPLALQCELSHAHGQVTWYKDGAELLANSGVGVQSEGQRRSLYVASAQRQHCGVYRCESKDDHVQFTVDVRAPPVTFMEIPEADLLKTVVEQEVLVLRCEVSAPAPEGEVQWYRDGAEVSCCERVEVQAEGTVRTLTLRPAELCDTGTYSCRTGDSVLIFKVTVRESPVSIVFPKEDVHLDRHVGEEVVLSCELSRPNGAVVWFKDGQKLQESENIKLKEEGPYRRLRLGSGRPEDSGEYVCDTDHDSIFFHINITEPPVRIVSPSQPQMELCQQTSERMVLSCEISRPNAVVRWYRDGLQVEESPNLLVEEDGVYRRLVIPKTSVQDSAEYVCDTSDDSMTFFVNIAEPPVRFLRPRKSVSKVEKEVGDCVLLECEVSRPNADVAWKRNGEEVEETRNVSIVEEGVTRQLLIHALREEEAGLYVCDAKDDLMDFTVTIKEAAVRFVGKPESRSEKTFVVGDDIILVCEVSRPNAVVTWCREGRPLEDSGRYCAEEQGVFRSLLVMCATREDQGEYSCEAGHDHMSFCVIVRDPPVQIVGNSGAPERHLLLSGEDLVLECEVSHGNAPVRWLKDGHQLSADTRVTIQSVDVVRKFVLTNLQPQDSGEYICDTGDDQMTTIVLVQEPPLSFLNKPPSASSHCALEGDNVSLSAELTRELESAQSVRWLKDDLMLVSGDNVHIGSFGAEQRLTLSSLQLTDSGEYVCDVGTDRMVFRLTVKETKVKFVRRLQSTVALRGHSLALQCEVNKASGDVQWLKDGQEVALCRRFIIRAVGTERSLTVHQVSQQDSGEYSCASTDDRTTATVTVEDPRVVEFVAGLRSVTVREGEDAVFKCVVSPEDVQLVWTMKGAPPTGGRVSVSCNGTCHTLRLSQCRAGDAGTVSANAEGVVSTAELQVQEPQVVFTRQMVPVSAEEYEEAVLEVEVDQEQGEVQWMRQGVLLHDGPKYRLLKRGRVHSLRVLGLGLGDAGRYSCETLHDRTQATLTVTPRQISIVKGLCEVRTVERETASLEVVVSHEDLTGTWSKNGTPLKNSAHYRISCNQRSHSLTIVQLSVEDTGTFTFSVQGLKTSGRLVVQEPPVTIIRKLEDQKFPEGAVISIECELSRHNVDVKWMKNGVEVKPSKSLRIYSLGRKRFLQVTKCGLSDSGVYTCDTGDNSTSCSVEVYERELLVLQELEDQEVEEEQNAVFMCELSVEDVSGEWFKKGLKIQQSSSIRTRHEGTKHFLLMCNVRPEDSGEIKFVARDVESTAFLDVEELPVSIVKPLQDQVAVERSRVLLDCTVSTPRCSCRWYRGLSVILPSDRFEICSEGCNRKLIIQQVALEDEGEYSVQVGEDSCSARLSVEAQSVTLVRHLSDLCVRSSEEACFEVEVSAPLTEAPVWTLEGEVLEPGPRVLVEKMGTVHRLTLRGSQGEGGGVGRGEGGGEVVFCCGEMRSSARLSICE